MKLGHMRPHDVAILLKIVAINNHEWRTTDLANQLFISQSEISQSLFRNMNAGLIDSSKEKSSCKIAL